MNTWMELSKGGFNPVIEEVRKCKCGKPRHISLGGVVGKRCKECMNAQSTVMYYKRKGEKYGNRYYD